MVVRCLDCETVKRFCTQKDYQLWVDKPQAWVTMSTYVHPPRQQSQEVKNKSKQSCDQDSVDISSGQVPIADMPDKSTLKDSDASCNNSVTDVEAQTVGATETQSLNVSQLSPRSTAEDTSLSSQTSVTNMDID